MQNPQPLHRSAFMKTSPRNFFVFAVVTAEFITTLTLHLACHEEPSFYPLSALFLCHFGGTARALGHLAQSGRNDREFCATRTRYSSGQP